MYSNAGRCRTEHMPTVQKVFGRTENKKWVVSGTVLVWEEPNCCEVRKVDDDDDDEEEEEEEEVRLFERLVNQLHILYLGIVA